MKQLTLETLGVGVLSLLIGFLINKPIETHNYPDRIQGFIFVFIISSCLFAILYQRKNKVKKYDISILKEVTYKLMVFLFTAIPVLLFILNRYKEAMGSYPMFTPSLVLYFIGVVFVLRFIFYCIKCANNKRL